MAKQYRNHNIRFNMGDELAVQAWERLHSEEVEQSFKSQNAFVVAAINDYYERHLAKKNDPYLESREKEDAFADRLVQTVEQKLLSKSWRSRKKMSFWITRLVSKLWIRVDFQLIKKKWHDIINHTMSG